MVFVGQKMPSKFFAGNKGEELAAGNTSTPVSSPSLTPSPTPYSGSRPETVILSGPEEGEFVKDEATVVFHFAAIWPGDMKDISFETKVSGIDNDWQGTSVTSRSFILLAGDHTYKFQVRAKTKDGIYDLTPAERNFRSRVSEYIGKVKIISAYPGRFPNQIMKITIRNDAGSLKITNWTIESTKGKFNIPAGIGLYDPSIINQTSDIVLNSGDYLFIFGQTSPMDMNFRLNRCFGYLNNLYNFEPDLPRNCPYPERSELNNLSLSCQNYILNLSACEIPKSEDLNNLVGEADCRSFAESRFNYSGCLKRYRYSTDFFEREWYTYSTTDFLSLDHDNLILRDKEGLFVDSYNY